MEVEVYIYRYTDPLAVLLVHVGLAQARPNYLTYLILADSAAWDFVHDALKAIDIQSVAH